MVITNGWFLSEMLSNEFLVQLDQTRIPNFYKYASPLVRDPHYDPGNAHSVTWQSGFTGIGYNADAIKREITSFEDLRDPAFSGSVGMMNDTTELGCAALLAIGIDPARSTPDDWNEAAKWLRNQRPLVSGYYDQSYIDHLKQGDTIISQAWSGDIFQANLSGFPNLKFVTPKEGQIVWHDNLVIPMQAANPVSAMEWMNYYYTPRIAGIVADWVEYVCPVPLAQQYIEKVIDDPGVANSPLVFPSAEVAKMSRTYYDFRDLQEYETWNNIFNAIVES
jgi:spermidine/putrescine transport system substrate-binding protein